MVYSNCKKKMYMKSFLFILSFLKRPFFDIELIVFICLMSASCRSSEWDLSAAVFQQMVNYREHFIVTSTLNANHYKCRIFIYIFTPMKTIKSVCVFHIYWETILRIVYFLLLVRDKPKRNIYSQIKAKCWEVNQQKHQCTAHKRVQ